MSGADGFRILTVCSGNVCRSPFVELLLGQRLAARPDFTVASAGTIARPGQRMTAEMLTVAARYGVPAEAAEAHVAARLDEASVARADLVLGLTREHRAAALRLFPGAVKRVFTLNEFARLAGSVAAGRETLTATELVAEAASRRALEQPSAPEADDIDDPIGLPQEVYDRVGAEIVAAADAIAPVLVAVQAGAAREGSDPPNPGEPRLSFSFRRL